MATEFNNKPSIENIAEEADVSTATVSRVLNNSDRVREETAKRVLEVVNRLNYQTNRVARRMRVKNTNSLIIGLIITDVGNPFFSELVRGVEDIAYKNKQAVLISNTDEDPEKEKFYIDSMLSEKISGLIIAPTTGNSNYLENLVSQNIPVISVDRKPEIDIDTVTTNNKLGAYKAVHYLIKLGHKRIGLVNGIKGLSTTKERYNGYKMALEEANLEIDEDLIIFENYKEQGGCRAAQTLLNSEEPPTAIFSTNNLMTLGCIEAIYEMNLKIPDDISLIGFDDMPWSNALNPPLTVIKQQGYDLGTNAAELLIKRLNNSSEHNTIDIKLNPELIVRKSCSSPKF